MKYIFIVIIFLYSCASVQPLSGGDKDETPPKVLITSTDSAAVNVATNVFEFYFDEYIQQKQAIDKLLISPNQTKPPTFTVKKKKLTIELNDSLIPNTTYTFQFNGAITDINENNPLNNYSYIFSTGSYIDSSTYNGSVIDFKTKKPCAECNVHLYKEYTDTTILKIKPSYLTRTNDNGTFRFTNLPNSKFTVTALQDENKNLFYDKEELISLPILINTDSSSSDTFSIFESQNTEKYKVSYTSSKTPGTYHFTINKPLLTDSIQVLFNNLPTPYKLSRYKDTVSTHYAQTTDTLAISVIINSDTTLFRNILPLKELKYKVNPTISGQKKIRITTKTPLVKIDSSAIILLLDSIKSNFTIQRLDTFSFQIISDKEYTTSEIILPKSSLTDIYNQTNKGDTLDHTYTKNEPTVLTLKLTGDTSVNYILTIEQNKKIVRYNKISNTRTLIYNDLKPGDYKVTIYTDINKNGIWDTGNIFYRKPPEPITVSESFELRQNWDKELTINIK